MRSPTGPPMNVPAATAPSRMNRCSCALCTESRTCDQVERVEAGQARQVHVLREHQQPPGWPATAARARPDRPGADRRLRPSSRATTRCACTRRRRAPGWPCRRARSGANQAMLRWPCGSTMKAASSGPIADPALPPTWKSDCAKPCRPPEAIRATRDDSGWKIDEPMPTQPTATSTSAEGRRQRQQQQADQREAHADRQRIRLGRRR